jgi:hypothetical protein
MVIFNNQIISFIIQAPIPILIPLFVNNLYKLVYNKYDISTQTYTAEYLERKHNETNKYNFISIIGSSSIISSIITNIPELAIGGGLTLLLANINYWSYFNTLSKTFILGSAISTLFGIRSLL